MTLYQVLVPVIGAILGLVIVFLVMLGIAPFWQRNEARRKVDKLTLETAELKRQYISQMNEKNKTLNDPLLRSNQEEHSLNIKEFLGTWAVCFTVPPIGQVWPYTTSPTSAMENDFRFDYLKEHLPATKLWQDYYDWNSKMQEYLDKCKELRIEIHAAWKIEGTETTPNFATSILDSIEGNELHFLMAYGTGHGLEELEHQMLNVNGRDTVYGIEYKNDPNYQDLIHEKCKQLILCKEYTRIANDFLSTSNVARIRQLSLELLALSTNIRELLRQYLESGEYNKHCCKDCPIQPLASDKGDFQL